MTALPPPDTPLSEKSGRMALPWYRYFWEWALPTRPDIRQSYIEISEITDPVNGPANTGRMFCRDNGAGKSQICVIFATGVVQVMATEP
jgi:hypothetical protein